MSVTTDELPPCLTLQLETHPLPAGLAPPVHFQLDHRLLRFRLVRRPRGLPRKTFAVVTCNGHRTAKIEFFSHQRVMRFRTVELLGILQTLTGLALDRNELNAAVCICYVPRRPKLLAELQQSGYEIIFSDGQPYATATMNQAAWLQDA